MGGHRKPPPIKVSSLSSVRVAGGDEIEGIATADDNDAGDVDVDVDLLVSVSAFIDPGRSASCGKDGKRREGPAPKSGQMRPP